jgi:septal ring factor EnvC (AmiA/AmiB activator)
MSRAWSPITVEGIEKRIQALKQQQDDIKQMNAKMEKERKELKEKEDQIIKCRVTLYKLSDPKLNILLIYNTNYQNQIKIFISVLIVKDGMVLVKGVAVV